MLAQVARQILDQLIKLKELLNAWITQVQARITKLPLAGIVWIFPFPRVDQGRKTRKHFVIKIQRLAYLARCGAPAIGDDISSHGRSEFSVTFVNVLNCFLTLISTRQIEIDVGPFASFLRKKSFKQQIHADRIHGRDSQRITDRAVCRRASSLDQDALFATKLDDV